MPIINFPHLDRSIDIQAKLIFDLKHGERAELRMSQVTVFGKLGPFCKIELWSEYTFKKEWIDKKNGKRPSFLIFVSKRRYYNEAVPGARVLWVIARKMQEFPLSNNNDKRVFSREFLTIAQTIWDDFAE